MLVIYWTVFRYSNWEFIIAATEKGLCFTGSENQGVDELRAWVNKAFKGMELIEDKEKLAPYAKQFQQYFDCQRGEIDFPLDFKGTDFQMSVWAALRAIPYGTTYSYSDIAERLNNPKSVRAVGTAIGSNPVMIVIPCHRVIGKNGTLTGFRAGLDMKKRLLELEGIKL
ncbi:methylated-DNA--[protein]-cysteine S-methyltransferase [Lysinibacillus sp. 54212]|uniref:methylated-DNA--[protein]-cysteine S-methyltransferase n=1 Tax=Lysinibacillus sp. 54212 TaxID=3119829 RepID=UPI002FC666C6